MLTTSDVYVASTAGVAELYRADEYAREAAKHVTGFEAVAPTFPDGVTVHECRGEHMTVAEGVARIRIRGSLMPEVPSWLRFFGVSATSTFAVRDLVERAAADPSVRRIVLDIDSHGGLVQGTAQLADAVWAAREAKTVDAIVTGGGAFSAAYWIASQCSSITIADPLAEVGSIGIVATLRDYSAAFEQAGIGVVIIRSPESASLKGQGAMGTPVTDELRAEVQARAGRVWAVFAEHLERGRSGLDLETIATGGVFGKADALRLNLIDDVSTSSATGAPAAPVDDVDDEEDVMSGQNDAALAAMKEELDAKSTKLAAEAEARAKADARAQAAESALSAVNSQRRTDLIEAAAKAGKVTPAMREKVEAYAAKCDGEDGLNELGAFLASLPTQTRSGTVGGDDTRADDTTAAGVFTAEQIVTAHKLRRRPEDLYGKGAMRTDGVRAEEHTNVHGEQVAGQVFSFADYVAQARAANGGDQ